MEVLKIIKERKYFVNEIRLIHFSLTRPHFFTVYICVCVCVCDTCWCVCAMRNKTKYYIYRYTNSNKWQMLAVIHINKTIFSSWNFRLTYELSAAKYLCKKGVLSLCQQIRYTVYAIYSCVILILFK